MRAAPLTRGAYSALGIAITPVLHLWLNRRAKRGKEDVARKAERFGHASIARPTGALLWLHAASVGETQSVLTLVRALLEQHPQLHLLITTGTVTSANLVAQQTLPRTIHQFVPVDTATAVRRFLNYWHPDIAVWVESEFWPQLLWQSQSRHIPMLLINARISQSTYENWKKWPNTIRSLLHSFCSIYAGSTEDATRLATLGGTDIRDVGNLKYDAAPLPTDPALIAELASLTENRKIFLAASTHANEEQLVAETHSMVAQQFPELLTIIVPRHAARGDAIAADLRNRNITIAQRSKKEPITATTSIYLADTMGELGNFYQSADIVFMGGSLIAHGGQNPLEAARFGKPILTGPHTHNFAAIIAQFTAANAIRIISNKTILANELIALLNDATARSRLADHATSVLEKSRSASAIILQQCSELIERSAA
ncbi:MAG: 3-deoxy-D-manno-octulosonic acid transferase [Rickettsiales bacterium]